MTDKIRVEQREELFTELGLLADPIRRLVFSEEDPRPRIPYVRAQFEQEKSDFLANVRTFCFHGKYFLSQEYDHVMKAVNRLGDSFGSLQTAPWADARHHFPLGLRRVQDAIRAIPCDDPDEILPGESPFRTYVRLRAICQGANNRIHIFDPYLEASTFHRYLNDLPEHIEVAVITSEKIMVPPGNDQTAIRRRDRIVAVSELFAAERPSSYCFLVTPKQHDRHLRVDETIISLGGSMKDAAKEDPYTIAKLDPTQSTHAFLDSVIASATEWFGPNVKPHRRT